MGRGDPFVNHVLRLFRKWSLRLLKDKAKINVEKGCFLMGVTDETRTLRGHFHSYYDQDGSDLEAMTLPEVFVGGHRTSKVFRLIVSLVADC